MLRLDISLIRPQGLAMSPNSRQIPPSVPRRVEILAFPSVQLLDVAGPLQVFASANDRAAERGLAQPYAPCVIAPDGTARTTAGVTLGAEPLPAVGRPVDTLLVAGGRGVMEVIDDPALVGWVACHARGARRVASVCTGAFLLAATGLLDGRQAVTHWAFCERLQRRYPEVRVEADPIFVRDGPVWTSAGISAGIDLALALVEEDLGRALALAVARDLVVFLKRPGGQAQFSAALTLQSSDDRFAALHDWIAAHLGENLPLSRLAAQAGMSERSFMRRYRTATGSTPAQAVERLRVEAARQLLSETRMPVKWVATRCGFGTEETLRRSFLRVQNVTPSDYRDRF